MINKSLYLLCLIAFLGFGSIPSMAQSKYDLTTDTTSLMMYEEQRWEELYHYVIEAQNNDVDFYYLIIRGAMASFHTGRYFKAANLFEQAKAYKRGNDYVREIHYLSARYAQCPLSTSQCYEDLSTEAKKRYSAPQYKALQYLGIMSGYNYNQDQGQALNSDANAVYGDRIMFQDLYFVDLYAGHQFSPRWSLNQSIEKLSINKIQDAFTQNTTTGVRDIYQQDINTQQWSYNLNLWFNLNDKVYLYPFFTILNYKSNYLHINYKEDTYEYAIDNSKIKEEQYLYGLGFKLRQAQVNLEGKVSRLYTKRGAIYQSTLGLQFFPISGKKHYISTHWHNVKRSNSSDDQFNHHVFDLKMGINIKKGWIESSYSFGNQHFITENYGATVYNTYETINSILACNISYPVYQTLWLSINYKYMNYSSLSYYASEESGLYSETFTHHNHSISGGLIWYF